MIHYYSRVCSSILRAYLDAFILLNFLSFPAQQQINLATSWLYLILLFFFFLVKKLAVVLPETLTNECSAKIAEKK